MGVVYKARRPRFIGRTVAVKTIKLNEAGTGLSRRSCWRDFQTEARAAGSCSLTPYRCGFRRGRKRRALLTSPWNWWKERACRRCWMPAGVSFAADAAHHGADLQRAAIRARAQRGAPRHQARQLWMLTADDSGEDYGLWDGEDSAVRDGAAKRARNGHAQLHVPGTGEGPRAWMAAATSFHWA